jgi:K+/H+ antiporter YhaU regulatory subunit KhtT
VGLTVETCRIRRTTGATIIAIMRQGGAKAMPHPSEIIASNDVLVVLGKPADFTRIRELIAHGPAD